jgi:hypothetical protein
MSLLQCTLVCHKVHLYHQCSSTLCKSVTWHRMNFDADDVLVYRQGTNREEVASDLQIKPKHIQEWCKEGSAVVNPTKIEMTWVSLNNHIVKTLTPNVKMFSDVLKRSQTIKYLGNHFELSLSF